MTEKRFTKDDTLMFSAIKDNGKPMKVKEVVNLLNEQYEENIAIKQLIYTMLRQIDIEKINTEDAIYSARIVFTGKEFRLIRKIWKGDLDD